MRIKNNYLLKFFLGRAVNVNVLNCFKQKQKQ